MVTLKGTYRWEYTYIDYPWHIKLAFKECVIILVVAILKTTKESSGKIAKESGH